ncbi:hypothetical protein CFOL_v3_00105 [Cephalotus follicularis]|uniref:Uncharacterized protein n=1 Tax=Cephalotus follicularis TaxID=3775 RepID=A0A1Q3ALZ3_CEPFO|nr:hypothetical protein CFOL_v3_00105 [Cephalotus follicularis]
MTNSTEQQTLEEEQRASSDQNQYQGWQAMARAWLSAFPEAKAVSGSQVDAWIDSNFASLPPELQSMPRNEIIDRLLSIQNYMRFPLQEKEPNQVDLPTARFQRTDQWRPIYSWLESLDHNEVVKSKDIADWLAENPEVNDDLSFRHSRYHLMHYIKKCHQKILKRREKRKCLQQPNNESAIEVCKSGETKQPDTLQGNPLNNEPTNSEIFFAKRMEALRKYEILMELERKLAPTFTESTANPDDTDGK